MAETTVNQPFILNTPIFANTNVQQFNGDNEDPRLAGIASLLHLDTERIRDIMQWSRIFGEMKGLTYEREARPRILAQVYDSSRSSEVINKIANIRSLITDWDEDFKAPTLQTISNVLEVAALFPKRFPVPKIAISGDGEISFEFVKGKRRAVIDINEGSDFSYAYFQGNKFVPGKEAVQIKLKKLPQDLVKYFSD